MTLAKPGLNPMEKIPMLGETTITVLGRALVPVCYHLGVDMLGDNEMSRSFREPDLSLSHVAPEEWFLEI